MRAPHLLTFLLLLALAACSNVPSRDVGARGYNTPGDTGGVPSKSLNPLPNSRF